MGKNRNSNSIKVRNLILITFMAAQNKIFLIENNNNFKKFKNSYSYNKIITLI